MAGQEGFEPTPPGFGVRCSSRWSYWPLNHKLITFNNYNNRSREII